MELRRVAPSAATAGELRSFLAKFLFTGDDVYKHVRDLSGGEKGRLALAKLIYSRVNVLVLDEPTNHLDIPSREALEEALDAYQGTIITISHDRYFLDRVATQMLALDGAGTAEHYDGDYTEYHDWKAAQRASKQSAKSEHEKNGGAPGKTLKSVVGSAEAFAPRQAQTNHRKGVKKKEEAARDPQTIEAEVAEAEHHLAALTQQMASPEVARIPQHLMTITEDYRKTDERLRVLYEEWERVVAEATRV